MYRFGLRENRNRDALEAFGHGLGFGLHALAAAWHLTSRKQTSRKQSLLHAGLHAAVALYDGLSFVRHLDNESDLD